MRSVSRLPGVSDIRRALALAFFAGAATVAGAADHSPRFEVTPYAGYRFGGSFAVRDSEDSWEVDDSSSRGIVLNLRESTNTQWELIYAQQLSTATLDSALSFPSRIDLDVHIFQIGGTYQWDGDKVRPYLAATLGGTRLRVPGDSDTFFSGSIGIGLQVLPASRIGLRLEVRAIGTLTDSDTDLFCATGPDQNVCAIRVDGEMLGQVETWAGVALRF